ncbi:MLO-like protein 2 isoform X2 [Ipomoea triloba]|uniref:MLO-like protein 2 isoform X2 n=1 Tax=Ipomoea triloba TaxID=35885 RepID=UPI00125DD392|nr:MLO-like protein 2 isoform X2 [Ipomoea triloba]XP_031108243.1 MLO-like protein 2 isoform X2 [Ipomoea triloba]
MPSNAANTQGKVQFASSYAIHYLHIFIFALAVTHVLYSITTWGLGRLKMRTWKAWEDGTRTLDYQFYNVCNIDGDEILN